VSAHPAPRQCVHVCEFFTICPDPARAADEAKYARQIFDDSLLAIEIGNEPNFYYSSVAAAAWLVHDDQGQASLRDRWRLAR
jgi:hypothetical protein